MIVRSFYRQGFELRPMEVEITLLPGLPTIQIMGLPDSIIKESQLRIKAALKNQGFDWPTRQQILVNLRPPYVRKSSRGIDLAIACAYLWKSGQCLFPEEVLNDKPFVYGELSLDGRVRVPEDLDHLLEAPPSGALLSGVPESGQTVSVFGIAELKNLHQPIHFHCGDLPLGLNRPATSDLLLPAKAARLAEIVALGEHPLMIAGPAGSGKTTFAEGLYHLLADPSPRASREIQVISRYFNRPAEWRPLVAPHHTVTPLAMVGGGSPPFPGEISRAHGGLLILDEFLEFHTQVREALREPIERGEITVTRKGVAQKFKADFLLLATTNLCPCGHLVPNKTSSCRFSLLRCRSYLERLTGPILDRFAILAFSHEWRGAKDISLVELLEKIERGREFILESRGQEVSNQKLKPQVIEAQVDPFSLKNLMPVQSSSERRRVALLRVARTLADLDGAELIQAGHLDEAYNWTIRPHQELQEIHS